MAGDIRQDALLRKEDVLAIENVLYEPKKEELVARQFLRVNTNFPPYAQEIGYDWYDRTGSAKILASGGSAKDVPFVGEKGGRETMKVYDIVSGIRYTKAERQAAQAKAALGKGPSMNLDTMRVSSARRFIAETENRLAFADLLTGKKAIETGDLFKARVLLMSSDHLNSLLEPFSDSSPLTVLKWLQSEGAYFEKIITTSAMSKAHNSFSTVDCFCILDNDPEIIELAVPEDITLGDPVYDILGTSEQVASERSAGCIIRHPSGIYVGKGI